MTPLMLLATIVFILPLVAIFWKASSKSNKRNQFILKSMRTRPQFNPDAIYDTSIVEEKVTYQIHSLYIVPVCGGQCICLDECEVQNSGMVMDRTWSVVEKKTEKRLSYEAQLFTIKERIRTTKNGDSFLTLTAPNMRDLDIKIEENPDKMKNIQTMSKAIQKESGVRKFKDFVGYDEGEVASQWFSALLKKNVVLFRAFNKREIQDRPGLDSENVKKHDRKNPFHYGGPIHVTSLNSLNDLNQKLTAKGEREMHLTHFKQNILLTNTEPYEEDTLYEIRVKNVIFRFISSTVRCKIMSYDYDKQMYAINKEPMPTLSQYRRQEGLGVLFGTYMVVDVIEDKEFLAKLIHDEKTLKEALNAVTGTGRTLLQKGDQVYVRKRQGKLKFKAEIDQLPGTYDDY